MRKTQHTYCSCRDFHTEYCSQTSLRGIYQAVAYSRLVSLPWLASQQRKGRCHMTSVIAYYIKSVHVYCNAMQIQGDQLSAVTENTGNTHKL